ncbi:hypothetical protein [Lysinibacillus sphaericus]|uniref:hypothetical protein n=1 Tax=Lysinibacillus sphaericus TaxID=1421 RepID=UPI000C18A167|nr:hypothetical protein [Lysinibacillus sphaericus]PIJ95846.1 hypothetical protein CTN02_22045 [Lysinibacillus sphaericus]
MTVSLTKNKNWKGVLIIVGLLACLFFALPGFDTALAANEKEKTTGITNAADAASMAGITTTSDKGQGLMNEAKGWIYVIIGFALIFIAGCLVFAGAKMAASSNGQKRVEAAWWIGGSAIGAIVAYNAFKLIGLAIGAGSS